MNDALSIAAQVLRCDRRPELAEAVEAAQRELAHRASVEPVREVPPGKWRVDLPDGQYSRMPGDPPGPASLYQVIDGYVYDVEQRTGRLIATTPPTGFQLQKFNEEMAQRQEGSSGR